MSVTLAKGEDIPLVGEEGLGQRETQVQGQERHFPAALPCLVTWNPLGTRKRSSASSWFLSFFLVICLCLAMEQIPRTAHCDPHQQAGAVRWHWRASPLTAGI